MQQVQHVALLLCRRFILVQIINLLLEALPEHDQVALRAVDSIRGLNVWQHLLTFQSLFLELGDLELSRPSFPAHLA